MTTFNEFREYLRRLEFEKFLEIYEAEEVKGCDTCANRFNCRYEGCNGYEEE